MSRRTPPIFLERQPYRRRRVIDAVSLLPVFGAVLLAVPLLWPSPTVQTGSEAGPSAQVPAEAVPMSTAITYVFAVWVLLIVLAFVFGRVTRGWGLGQGALDRDPEA